MPTGKWKFLIWFTIDNLLKYELKLMPTFPSNLAQVGRFFSFTQNQLNTAQLDFIPYSAQTDLFDTCKVFEFVSLLAKELRSILPVVFHFSCCRGMTFSTDESNGMIVNVTSISADQESLRRHESMKELNQTDNYLALRSSEYFYAMQAQGIDSILI